MVDVGAKPVTTRTAEAECFLRVSAHLLALLRSASVPKGDALTVAQVAGTMAAKRTSNLIPMCHPLPLEVARVRVELPAGEGAVRITCEARATARTGVEMEALTGCAGAALALYDMCKSVNKHMEITGLRVLRKSGGASGDWDVREPAPAVGGGQRPGKGEGEGGAAPAHAGEPYAPTNFMNF